MASLASCGARRFIAAAKLHGKLPRLPISTEQRVAHFSIEPATTPARRSVLFVPAKEKMLRKAQAGFGADAVILDLEDAVAVGEKDSARAVLKETLKQNSSDWGGSEVIVRVNSLETPWGAKDLAALADLPGISSFMIPKTESIDDVQEFRLALGRAGAPDRMGIWCLIETPLGVLNAPSIAEAGKTAFGVQAIGVGTNDLTKEMQCAAVAGRAPLAFALSTVVTSAKAYGLTVLDGVYNNTADLEGFAAEARQARDLGFDGKTLIHPNTVQACHEAFAPSEAEVVWAERVVEAMAAAQAVGEGVSTVDGQLVEELHAVQARRVLAKVAANS